MPLNRKFQFNWGGYIVGFREKDGVILMKLSEHSFEKISSIKLQYNVSAYFEKYIYLYHTKDKRIKRLAIESLDILDIEGHLFPQINWVNLNCFLNIQTKKYEVYSKNGHRVFEFKYEYPVVTKFIASGILLFQNNEKSNNWISCLSPDGGNEKWKKEYLWQIVRLDTYENLIILEYHAYNNIRTDKGYEGERDWYHPSRYTIVLNGETGEEVWKYPNSYHYIDFVSGVILTGKVNQILSNGKIESLSAIELNIENGAILTEIEVIPTIEDGFQCHFIDNEGIYYISYNHSFGKISRINGFILWEFDLIDNQGEKRRISDWLLLGNGNLVLQTMPNHPNGDFTCIFNPNENMEYSKVKDGQRVA